ncbi:uncharacterized protein LOC123946526 [Meles meles]|uniref:uncharacterized protein LOC123946526 n=1 Tax=Meles meles TaxID=9662 RepID=UPI001E6A043B|nr:uncharacterized protein LOC123946526 [Meles meles]
MEKAGRRWLASAAPPLGRLRRRESGADEGGLGGPPGLEVPRSLARSGRDDAPRSGVGRPGSSFRCRRTSLDSGGWATSSAPSRRGPRLQRSARQVTPRSGASGCLRGRSPAGRPRPPGEFPGSGGWGRVRHPRCGASAVLAGRRCSRHSWKAPCARVSRGADSGSSPFLLLPGSLTREQCAPGQCAGTHSLAVTAPPAARTARPAALPPPTPVSAPPRLGTRLPPAQIVGAFIIYRPLVGFPRL